MARKQDSRQTISRDLLDQLTLSSSHAAAIANEKPVNSTELDNLLRSINSELITPVRLRANDAPDLIVNLDSALIVNPEKNKNRILPPVGSNAGSDMGDIFTGGTITFGANLSNAVTVSAGTGLTDLSSLSTGSIGHGSVGVFINSVGSIILSSSVNGVILANDLPFPVVKPGLEFIGMIEVEFDAGDNITSFDDSKLFQFTNSNTTESLVTQDRNLKLIGGGTWLWDLTSTTLSWSADSYLQVVGFDDDRNTLSTGSIVLAANEVAYIQINRVIDSTTVIPVSIANINAIPTNNDTMIIARRDGNDVIVGTHSFRLRDGQYLELDGALQEIRRMHDQLKIVTSGNVDEVDILSSDITQLDLVNGSQSTLVQELNDLVMNFSGANINFTTGVITGASGTNFVSPSIPVGEYQWFSIALKPGTVDVVNKISATVEVGIALSSNAVQGSAPMAAFEGDKKLGQVLVQNIGGTYTVVDIRRLGAGSGSGGGGDGMCATDLVSADTTVDNGTTCTNFYMDVQAGTTVTLEATSHFVSIDPTINGTLVIEPGSVFQVIDVDTDHTVKEPGDINETSFSALNNQIIAVNVDGLLFPNVAVRSFKALVSVEIDATADLYEVFELIGIQKGASWDMVITSFGDASGFVFTIDTNGQIQYTNNSYAGFVSATISFRAMTTNI